MQQKNSILVSFKLYKGFYFFIHGNTPLFCLLARHCFFIQPNLGSCSSVVSLFITSTNKLIRCVSCVETGADEAAIHTIELHLYLFLLILLLPCFYIMHVKGRWSNCKRRLTND